ncbi:MAG: oligoendopeptidase F [Clostridia bacterium]|nr:oligoendopeptidase F [Clostridia bacterium]
MAEKLRKRSEVPVQDTWKLEDIYPDNAAWEADFENVRQLIPRFAAYKGKLSDKDTLLEALKLATKAERIASSLFVYARMRRDEDNSSTFYQGLVARISQLSSKLASECAFMSPEMLTLSEEYLTGVKADPAFSDYDMQLDDLIRRRPHTLSEKEETLLALSRDMGGACGTVYDMFTDADLRFPEIEDENGEKVRLTHSNYIPFMMSRDRSVRKRAFEALYSTFKSFSATVPAIYAGSVKSDVFYAKARGHNSALEASLFPDNIPVSVYESLIQAVSEHISSLQKFISINSKLNGIDKMHFYDLYLPPELGFDIKLPFADAYAKVTELLSVLGEDYTSVLKKAFEERWIDPYENEGKSSGAYSWGTYDSHPYVLTNYKEDLDHMQTVAHEMGHSLHTLYSDTTQPYTKSQYSLFVAEVASTVNEVLTLMGLMDRYKEDEAQAYLIYNLLDSFRGTVFRQTMFAEFEKASHAMEEQGEPLTAESLNKVYADLNRKYYPGLEFDELISYEWMRIPHFYNCFYVYKYATGFSAAMAIAGMIRAEGAPAVERYKRFLKAGCSVYPLDALKLAGVDLSSPEPVRSALKQFDEYVDKYEKVCAKLKK